MKNGNIGIELTKEMKKGRKKDAPQHEVEIRFLTVGEDVDLETLLAKQEECLFEWLLKECGENITSPDM